MITKIFILMIIFPAMKLKGIKANNRLKKFIFEKFKFENKYIFLKFMLICHNMDKFKK